MMVAVPKIIGEPAVEPVSVAEIKEQIRHTITPDDGVDDDLLARLIKVARKHAETRLRRSFITTTWRWTIDCFPIWEIEFPRAPLQSVESITYVDTDGTTKTVAESEYTVHADSEPGLIYPAWQQQWPVTRDVPNAVTITAKVGYGNEDSDVPEGIRHWIMMAVGALYENRELDQEAALSRMQFADNLLSAEAWETVP